eukprot:TRINITY_DN2284_c0_g1_i1.p1 TRINITY_DN2284_c0_g1~~TRINITY_DN2284_c0_g1_i1.p1  ORF type:complete len:351 (-),score=50.26 TRINITY_DN2284_c0_g1_i1:41-1093(-)
MSFGTNEFVVSEYLTTKVLSSQNNKTTTNFDNNNNNSKSFIEQQLGTPQQAISILTLQTSEISINEDQPSYYSFEKIPFISSLTIQEDSPCLNRAKARARTPKLCRICAKSVLDLRRHLEQCHKELTHLQVVKIVAESKRFRKDLKKQPSKAVRNVLLCPYTNEKGEICNRPIVEYKLYQHLKFYHHIHPKSDEGIRLVRQARANPFASKSIFPDSCDSILELSPDPESLKTSPSKLDSESYEVCVSFPVENQPTDIPKFTDTNNTQITESPTNSPIELTTPSSPIQSQPCVSTSPSDISCQLVSIGLNFAVSCSNLPTVSAPQEATCVITKQDNDTLFISIPNLTLSDA